MSALRSAAWSAVAFVAVYVISVRTAAGQRLDESAMLWAAASSSSHQWAQLLLLWVSEVTVLLAALTLVAVTAALRGGRVALGSAFTIGSVVVAAQVLKEVLTRPLLLTDVIANSFPSGHVAAVVGLAAAAVIAVPPRFRWLAAGLLAPAVGLTGLATIVLEWHRPSDVVGSVLLAVSVASLATLLTDRRRSASEEAADHLERRPLAQV